MRMMLKSLMWLILLLLCLGVTYYAFAYLLGPVNPNNDFKMKMASSGWVVPMHFYASGLALLLVPWQLSSWLRQRAVRMHRLLGLLYVVAVLLGGIAGLLMALQADGGWVAQLGFFSLAVLWLYCTGMAYVSILKGQVLAHQQWMYRSMALTCAGITLRLFLGLGLGVMQWPFLTVYVPTAWLCWTLNLAVCEWLIRRRRPAAW
ncbi:DUF2306 domain-containing protein [Marinicella meishanensis]|uniref:DUF2306 domain-containing protein n=1 Tax=Marinicella meishanensis TaxID=2873263 RepID=UPI001CC0E11D|nr:DUF2306 domain-containing protein [Marinicella sp. NBU2979]